MKVITQEGQIRKKSGYSTLFLHIPFINYIFYFFQVRAAYIALKNDYLYKKELPGLFATTVISLKFALYGTIGSSIIYLILLLFGMNPFGEVASWLMNHFGAVFAGMLSPVTAGGLFGTVTDLMRHGAFTVNTALSVILFIALSYAVTGFAGAFLARYNIQSDIKRNRAF